MRLILKGVCISFMLAIFSTAKAETMTVGQLKGLLQQGEIGELAVTTYVHGVVDGMLAMESLHIREHGTPKEFCKISDAYEAGTPIRHPAFRAIEIVIAWEREGQPLDALAVDMVLSFLDGQYGCK